MRLVRLEKELINVQKKRQALSVELQELNDRQKMLEMEIAKIVHSPSPQVASMALTFLEVEGAPEPGPEFDGLVRDCVADLATGCLKLAKEYFGLKNYEHWIGQRSDHSYGFGPAHGHVVFSIGLRNRLCPPRTEGEINACIAYVRLLVGKVQA